MTVDQMIADVIRREGGFIDHPADRGGPTKYGISEATLSRWRGRKCTAADVAALRREEAERIYREWYFEAPRIDQLPVLVQPFVFDAAVNHGPAQAIRFVQQVCNLAGFGSINEDGIMGPRTARTARDAGDAMQEWFLAALVEQRRNFYRALVERDQSQVVFLKGWLARLLEFDPEVLS